MPINKTEKIVMNRRIVYFDVLNILACICVIWLHFNNEIHWYSPTKAWYQAVVVQALAYWAVPIFFMLTGATLMSYRGRYTTKIFLKKRMAKIFVPYLIWGLFFAVWRIHRGEVAMDMTSFPQIVYSITSLYLNNRMEPIYWFFAPIFSIYISMPFLSLLSEKKNQGILKYCLSVGVLTISIIPFFYNLFITLLKSNLQGGWWNGAWQLNILGGYLLFPVLGYWAANHDFQKRERQIIYIIGLICVVSRLLGMIMLFSATGEKPEIFFDYLSFPSLAYALSIFVFFKHINYDNLRSDVIQHLSSLASCSFGVYLIHILVLSGLEKISFFRNCVEIWHFIMPLVCYIICVLCVKTVKHIPVLKYIFP